MVKNRPKTSSVFGRLLLQEIVRFSLENVKVVCTRLNAIREGLAVLEELNAQKVRVHTLAVAVVLHPQLNDPVDVATGVELVVVLSERRTIAINTDRARFARGLDRHIASVTSVFEVIAVLHEEFVGGHTFDFTLPLLLNSRSDLPVDLFDQICELPEYYPTRTEARIFASHIGAIVQSVGAGATLIELGAGFHPDMTGRENIALNGSILGLPRKEIQAVTDEIIDFSGLREFIDDPVKHYSSGMYVRLGFAVAMHMKPDVLLVDEVLAVGDEEFQRKCFDHLYSLRRAGKTIIVVSHGLGQLEGLCDEVAWLERGVMQQHGPAVETISAYLRKVNAEEAARNPMVSATREDDEAVRAGEAREKGVEVETITMSDLSVEGDSEQLKQVMWNLVRNAVQATDGGDVWNVACLKSIRGPNCPERAMSCLR